MGEGGILSSRPAAMAMGAIGAVLSVALGYFLNGGDGDGPLMAVFPVLAVTCLWVGSLGGGICLTGGIIGIWYVYLSHPFSFVINEEEARALFTASGVGALIIAICAPLRAKNVALRASSTASLTLAEDLSERSRELSELNSTLTRALDQRTRAEEALAESDAQFRASFEGAAVGKIQADPTSGRIIRANRAFANMLGYEPGELVNRNGWELTTDEDRAGDQEEYKAVLDGAKAAYIREKRYVHRDGRIVWGRISATISRSLKTGEPLMTIAVVENIDAQHKARVALQVAQERSEELREQLTHVWTLNSLGEMAAVLAHELNQPLSAITNYMRGARSIVARLELPDDTLLDAVDQAGRQAIRAGEIIRRMRSMIARDSVDRHPESLATVISEIDFIIRLVTREAGIEVLYSFSDGPDVVLIDRIQIQQVITNLVRNAAEALRDQALRSIEITIHPTAEGWVVRVGDSGPGVSAEMKDKLFLPMTSSKKQGMGLGLSISRAIVAHHGGEIWLDRSRLGGAAFCFSLPSAVSG